MIPDENTLLAFCDIETLSLARPFHDHPVQISSVGLITRYNCPCGEPHEEHREWFLPVDVKFADPESLEVNGFHTNHPMGRDYTGDRRTTHQGEFIQEFIGLTKLPEPDPKTIFIGNVPSFDDERLAYLLHLEGKFVPPWHYHLVCTENLIAGKLGIQPPWNSKELSEAIGVPVPENRHTALVDAKWARDEYDAVYGTKCDPQWL